MVLEGALVSKSFGALKAVDEITFRVDESEIVGLIGPNGAGKTTLFNLICGLMHPDQGTLKFYNHDITHLAPYEICNLGITKIFQTPALFHNMTVLENVTVAACYGGRKSHKEARRNAPKYLNFLGLEKKCNESPESLNLFERKLVEIARALATGCKLLLLDEVLAGLTQVEVKEAVKMIRRIRDEFKISIFWIEHVMSAIREGTDRVIVMSYGKKIAEGNFEDISKDEKVIEAYLGTSISRRD
ncbi:MAG: ABC transporter ATP-binding protein [Candidatus Bathyarchaeia archaeon]